MEERNPRELKRGEKKEETKMEGVTKGRPSRELIPWRPPGMGWDRDFEELVEGFLGPASPGTLGFRRWIPRVESYHKNGSYVIKADLPGVNPKDIHIMVEVENLILQGERKMDQETKRRDFSRREVFYGAFQRTVPIPRGLRAEAMKAKYRDGVLEITAPVGKAHLPKEVKVEVEKAA
jgi:HSP20 family protein